MKADDLKLEDFDNSRISSESDEESSDVDLSDGATKLDIRHYDWMIGNNGVNKKQQKTLPPPLHVFAVGYSESALLWWDFDDRYLDTTGWWL